MADVEYIIIDSSSDQEIIVEEVISAPEIIVEVLGNTSSGTSDHGELNGLSDDDHTQYHNDSRGDARYYTKSQIDTSLGNYLLSSTASSTYALISHTHTASQITDFSTAADARITAQKAQPSGLATLDVGGKVPTSQLPALALTDVFTVVSQVAQLALTAEEGDVAIRTDLNKSYIHNGGTSGTMTDWSELLTPTDTVLSVNGLTGAVTLTTTNIAEGTNLYYTTERAQDDIGAMVSGNTESLITVTYNDVSGKLNFAVTSTLSSYTNNAGFITSSALSGYVPYSGATTSVDLGSQGITSAFSQANIFSTGSYFAYSLETDANDLETEGHSAVIITPTTSGFSVHNVRPPLGNNDFLYVMNGSDTESFFISNNADSGTPEWNFTLPAAQNLLVPPRTGVIFYYDKQTLIWRMLDNLVGAEIETLTPSADQDDYVVSGFLSGAGVVTQVNIAPTNSIKITGIDATGVADGKEIIFTNTTDPLAASSRIIIFERQSTASTDENRITYPAVNMPAILLPQHSFKFKYNLAQQKWVLVDTISSNVFFDLYSDFFVATQAPFAINTGGTGSTVSITQYLATDTTYKTQGTVNCTLGTNTNGRAYISTGITSLMFGYGSFISLTRIGIAVLSDATNEFVVQAGFSDSNTSMSTDGATWVYERTSSTDWRTRTSNNGSATQNTITGFTVTVDTMPYLGTFVNGDATNVDFFYSTDGETWTFTTPHTTNIPSGTARTLGFQSGGHKTAGTTSRNVAVDSAGFKSIMKRGQ